MNKILKAVLGWANPETHGGNSLRLYALDEGASPRWAENGGRTVEKALIDTMDGREGDRYLIVNLGDRFVPDEFTNKIIQTINSLLEEDTQ